MYPLELCVHTNFIVTARQIIKEMVLLVVILCGFNLFCLTSNVNDNVGHPYPPLHSSLKSQDAGWVAGHGLMANAYMEPDWILQQFNSLVIGHD